MTTPIQPVSGAGGVPDPTQRQDVKHSSSITPKKRIAPVGRVNNLQLEVTAALATALLETELMRDTAEDSEYFALKRALELISSGESNDTAQAIALDGISAIQRAQDRSSPYPCPKISAFNAIASNFNFATRG